MFTAIKKRTVILCFLALLFLSVGLGIYGAFTEKDVIVKTSKAVVGGVSDRIILLDPGHGGADAGASANGISEKDVNLSVAKELKACIEELGGKVIMTREEDCSTADGSENGSWKVADLKKRKAMADETGADIFVSVHMNKFPQEKYKGAQVFYSADDEESRRLGEIIQRTLPEILCDGNTRSAKPSDGSIFILKNTNIPSVIVECGFISNVEEAEKLKDANYQKTIAGAICTGIERYFNQNSEI